MEPITGLAYGRIAIGALSLLSPSLTARLFLLDPTTNPQLSYMGRMFGSREIALGAITLASSGEARTPARPARRRRRRCRRLHRHRDRGDSARSRRRPGFLLTVVAAAAVATGVMELQES